MQTVEPPLVVSSYTLGTGTPYEHRVRAAAGAGFDGIGLRAENYWQAVDAGWSLASMRTHALDNAVPVREVEYVTGWGTAADRTAEQRLKEQTVFEMARGFGVGHVNAGLLERLSNDELVEAFAGLCDRAGDDVLVALEFMPYSGVADLRTAWSVVDGAGRRNGRLLVDLWHWARAHTTADDLAGIAPETIVSVQVCDVGRQPMSPLRSESLGHRVLPGHGHGDAVGVLEILRAHGVRPAVVGVEVISDELVARGVDTAAALSAQAAREVLGAAGWC